MSARYPGIRKLFSQAQDPHPVLKRDVMSSEVNVTLRSADSDVLKTVCQVNLCDLTLRPEVRWLDDGTAAGALLEPATLSIQLPPIRDPYFGSDAFKFSVELTISDAVVEPGRNGDGDGVDSIIREVSAQLLMIKGHGDFLVRGQVALHRKGMGKDHLWQRHRHRPEALRGRTAREACTCDLMSDEMWFQTYAPSAHEYDCPISHIGAPILNLLSEKSVTLPLTEFRTHRFLYCQAEVVRSKLELSCQESRPCGCNASADKAVDVEKTVQVFYRWLKSNGSLTDFALLAGGRRVACHRAILAYKSEVFRAMLDSGMKETTSRVLEFPDLGERGLLTLVDHLYGMSPSEELITSEDLAWELMPVVDRYSLSQLRSLCERFLVGTVRLDNAMELAHLAKLFNLEVLKEACLACLSKELSSVTQDDALWKKLYSDPTLLVDVLNYV